MKLLKNRLFLGILCILVGLLFSFVAVPVIQGTNQSSYTTAVRVKEPVRAGTKMTDEMIETASVPEKFMPGVINNASSVVGKYALSDLYAGDYLTAAKLVADLSEQDTFSAGIPKGKLVVSVTLPSLASGVSGKLLPGDVVTVMALPKNAPSQSLGLEPDTGVVAGSKSDVIVYPELQYIEVCMMSANDGTEAEVENHPEDDAKNSLPVTVSFFASKEQALILAELEQQRSIHLAFVARGEAAAQYLPDGVFVESEVV